MSNKLDLSKELIGRRALVTGGTRDIGAAIAQRLLDADAHASRGPVKAMIDGLGVRVLSIVAEA